MELLKVTQDVLEEAEKLTGIKPKILRWAGAGKLAVVKIGAYQGPVPSHGVDSPATKTWLTNVQRMVGSPAKNGKAVKHRKTAFKYGTLMKMPRDLGVDLQEARTTAGHSLPMCASCIVDNHGNELGPATVSRVINDSTMENIGTIMHSAIITYIVTYGGYCSDEHLIEGDDEEVQALEGAALNGREQAKQVFKKGDSHFEATAPKDELTNKYSNAAIQDAMSDHLGMLRAAELGIVWAIIQQMVYAGPLAAQCTLLVHEAQAAGTFPTSPE